MAVGMLGPAPARATWLELCPGNVASHLQPLSRIAHTDGTALSIFVSDAPSSGDCARLDIDVPTSHVLALHPVTASTAADMGDRFSLSVRQEGGHTLISDIAPGRARAAIAPMPEPLPLASNLLAGLQATAFGTENRASVTLANAQLTLQCAAGQQPAGVRLSTKDLLPRARSQLQLTAHGQGIFELLSASADQATAGDALRLGLFTAQPTPQSPDVLRWTPREGTWGETWRHWAIACPLEGGQLVLHSLQLLPLAAPVPGRATWVWQASEWQGSADVVLQRAEALGLKTLFITVPLRGGTVQDPQQLQSFVQRAAARGVSVWAVDGDPAMVLPTERNAAALRARAYARFNRVVHPGARLQGVQFDVEPYLLKGHALSDAEMDGHYLALVKSLHEALRVNASPGGTTLPLEMVVPFWWSGRNALLTQLIPLLSGLVVMDYRTNPKDIYRFAVPFLDWGEAHGKNVRIALEAGPIAAENRQRYEKADTGTLWPVQLGGRHFLMLLKTPQKNPQGESYRMAGSYVLDGSATTFRNDMPSLWQQLPMLEAMFSAWPHFKGMALHELPCSALMPGCGPPTR